MEPTKRAATPSPAPSASSPARYRPRACSAAALPVDMIASILANASTCRRRNGDSSSTSRSARDSFSGVQSSCRNSGTTLSPTTRLARITEGTWIIAPHDQGLDRAGAIGRHHRHARQRQFQRHGAGLRQRRMRDPERGALLRLADHDPGLHRPVRHALAHRFHQMRHGRQDQFERDALVAQPAERRAEHRHVMPDLAAAAARQHQQHRRRRRRGASARRRPGRSAPICSIRG